MYYSRAKRMRSDKVSHLFHRLLLWVKRINILFRLYVLRSSEFKANASITFNCTGNQTHIRIYETDFNNQQKFILWMCWLDVPGAQISE